ncbi:MAG: aconitate hydratase [Candidatus Latescibacterota bacterium]
MGYTLAQKIFKEHLGSGGDVTPGAEIGLVVDQCLTQDSTGTLAWLEFESLGLERVRAKTVVSYCDHTSLAFKGESADDHAFLRSTASKYGAIYSKPGNGVCHQLHYERFGAPGTTLLGSDSHTPTAGGLGMMGIGVGGMDVAVAMAGGLFYLTVPKCLRVHLTGALPWGVDAKDVILELLRRIGVKGGVGRIIEYDGPGVATLSVPQRATITNMGAETGATTSLFPSDAITRAFLEAQNRGACWRSIQADPDANADEVIGIALSDLEPLVAMPGMPDNVHTMDEVQGTHLDQVFIGSCTNGGVRDLRIAAEMLRGKTVAPHLDVIVSPGSRQVQEILLKDGSIEALTRSGARVIDPGCNACIGIGFVPGDGQLSLRTVNRNWPGRGGNKNGRLALCSAQVAAASALAGVIADPRTLPPVTVGDGDYIVDDLLLLPPKGPETPILRTANIVPIRPQTPLPQRLDGEALLKVGDGISTDDILPAGPLTQHLRSNLPAISRYVYHYEDATFPERALRENGGFIVGGENYGQGSSREHAALAPKELGITAVLAQSFARIHRTNLINCGIVPLVCDTSRIEQGDRLQIALGNLGNEVNLTNRTQNVQIAVHPDWTDREKDILRAGGILAYSKGDVLR